MFSVCYILTQCMSTLEIFLMIMRYINVHLIIIIIIIILWIRYGSTYNKPMTSHTVG